jgi:hypothetical protein
MRQMMNTLVNAQNDYLIGRNQFNVEEVLHKQKEDLSSPIFDTQLKQGTIDSIIIIIMHLLLL